MLGLSVLHHPTQAQLKPNSIDCDSIGCDSIDCDSIGCDSIGCDSTDRFVELLLSELSVLDVVWWKPLPPPPSLVEWLD